MVSDFLLPMVMVLAQGITVISSSKRFLEISFVNFYSLVFIPVSDFLWHNISLTKAEYIQGQKTSILQTKKMNGSINIANLCATKHL